MEKLELFGMVSWGFSVSGVRRVFLSIVGSSPTFAALLFIFLTGESEIGGPGFSI